MLLRMSLVQCSIIVFAFAASSLLLVQGLQANESDHVGQSQKPTAPTAAVVEIEVPAKNQSLLPLETEPSQASAEKPPSLIDKQNITTVQNTSIINETQLTTGPNDNRSTPGDSEQHRANETSLTTAVEEQSTTEKDAATIAAGSNNSSSIEDTSIISSTSTTIPPPSTMTWPNSTTIANTASEIETSTQTEEPPQHSTIAAAEKSDEAMSSGVIALVMAIAFAVVVIIVYAGLLLWRRYLEYRYGNRELLVNDLEFDTNDLRHFEL